MDALGTGQMPPMWKEVGRLTMPIDLMVGALDSKFRAIAERMMILLPNARLRIVARAGHNAVLENPQAVRDVIHEGV